MALIFRFQSKPNQIPVPNTVKGEGNFPNGSAHMVVIFISRFFHQDRRRGMHPGIPERRFSASFGQLVLDLARVSICCSVCLARRKFKCALSVCYGHGCLEQKSTCFFLCCKIVNKE